MNISVPDHVKREIDGVPFIGEIDVSDLKAEKTGDKISLTWKSYSKNKSDKLEIFVTETNRFKEGGEDEYKKAGEATISDEKFEFKPNGSSPFYKILVKTKNHYANAWIVQNTKTK
jgi:hypothetical protein